MQRKSREHDAVARPISPPAGAVRHAGFIRDFFQDEHPEEIWKFQCPELRHREIAQFLALRQPHVFQAVVYLSFEKKDRMVLAHGVVHDVQPAHERDGVGAAADLFADFALQRALRGFALLDLPAQQGQWFG